MHIFLVQKVLATLMNTYFKNSTEHFKSKEAQEVKTNETDHLKEMYSCWENIRHHCFNEMTLIYTVV